MPLYEFVCPPAVPRLVMPLGVDAVERRPIRTDAHVVEKVLENYPLRTNQNPPAPIKWELVVLLVSAALEHRLPRPPRRRVRHPVAKPRLISRPHLWSHFETNTPTSGHDVTPHWATRGPMQPQ